MTTAAAPNPTLALFGARPVRSEPFPSWPRYSEEEIGAAAEVLRSGKVNYWTGGHGRAFESEYAFAVGLKHAIAVANGTAALELALYSLGIGPGDEVITSSRTFIASASCAVMRGASPVVADVDRDSGNITADTIRARITPKTKAVIVVHLAGWPCEMDAIMELSRQRGLFIVEDCAQAHGARYKGRPVGSFGHINAFSFCQDKIITTGGEGGLVVTEDDRLWQRAWAFKDHGKSHEAAYAGANGPGFRWLHESFGTNWRLTEMQAAIGRIQLRSLPASVEMRGKNASVLATRLSRLPSLRIPKVDEDTRHSYYKFYCYLRKEKLRQEWTRDRILEAINAEGVPCFSGSCSEIYLEKAFNPSQRPAKPLPVAKELGETSLMFLVHPTLSQRDLEDTCSAVERVLSVATL